MLRKIPISRPTLIGSFAVLFAAVLFAGGTTVWLVLETRKEQRTIAELLRGNSSEVIRDIGDLPGELRWQFAFSILVLIVLAVVAVALVRLFRALLVSERSLHEMQTRSLNILASMDHAVITTDREGRVTSMNPRGKDMLEVGKEPVGCLLEEICPREMALHEVSDSVLETHQPVHERDIEITRVRRWLRYRVDCHLLNDAQNRVLGTVLHVRDVTDRALMEERMRRMERFMGLGNLAAGLHHEIKNPLSALSIHVQLLEERFDGQSDTELAENLAVLKTEVTRIGGVLESFRDFASVAELTLTPVYLPEVVERTVRLIRPKAEKQKVEIVREIGVDPGPVHADVTRLEQVLLNLALNALDAMPDGGQLTMRVVVGDEEVAVEVVDTGPGIPQNIRSQLFDPYFTTKSDGSGMGLAICDKIAQQHGGQISFSSDTEGTVFRLSLPTKERP